jgi:hypothetical protein
MAVLGILAALAAGSFAQAQTTLPPGVAASLAATYGRYNQAGHCWMAAATDADGVTVACMALKRADPVQTGSARLLYLMLGGNGRITCHACSGVIAFAVFDVTATPRLVAHSPATKDGSFGASADAKAVSVRQLGAQSWGWVETYGYTAQGETTQGTLIWLPKGDRVVRAGDLPGSHSNMDGACSLAPPPPGMDCAEIAIALRIDASNPAAAAYPIVLQATGTKNRRKVSTQAISVFDPVAFAYPPPSGLP